MFYIWCIIKTNNMSSQDILNERDERGVVSLSNEVANWYAISRGGIHVITFYDSDTTKYYKTELSWAKRLVRLLNTGN